MIELYCDESRQDLFYNKSVISDINKYIFIGGIMFDSSIRDDIKNKIKQVKKEYKVSSELKWNRVTEKYIDLYKKMIDIYIDNDIKFRSICIDSRKIDLKYHNDNPELGFYKFYYQLLNRWLLPNKKYIIYTDIKTYKDPNVLKNLKEHLNHNSIERVEKIYAIDSNESIFLQLEDIIMGATSYKMNYNYNGKSKAKLELVDYLEKRLGHEISPTSKNATKFNLFEINLNE